MKEQLAQLQKIAKELSDAIIGLQAEYTWEREKLHALLKSHNIHHIDEEKNKS